jgi:GH15 family glucan-1,4-alpha-glucosidase
VRVGNAAIDQLQLDVYGALIDSIYLYDKWGQPISSDLWDRVCAVVNWVCDHWDQPDEGIWETRGGRKNFRYSRLMCWVAIERAMRMAHQRGLPADMPHWGQTRDAIYRQVMQRGWSAVRQAFVQHEDDDVLDAAVVMMPLAKFISPTDPKWLATLDALTAELVSDSLVYRYDPHASPDGLQGVEGTFSLCSFWYVEALVRAGRLKEARLAFEKMLTYANHLGLYAEQISPHRRAAGQLPAGPYPPGADQRRVQPRPRPRVIGVISSRRRVLFGSSLECGPLGAVPLLSRQHCEGHQQRGHSEGERGHRQT